MARNRGKKYEDAKVKVQRDKTYPVDEALKLVKEVSTSKFDGSIDAHIRLKQQKKKDQEQETKLRGNLSLPHTVQRENTVIVFCGPAQADQAKKAGATEAGLEDLIKKIEDGWTDFDIAIAVPEAMPEIAKLGKILGPKGMMPNPKTGTVTQDFEKTVKEYKAGKVEFKSDDTGIIHISIGKVSFEDKKLRENFDELVKAILSTTGKTADVAIETITLAPTMGPSVKVDLQNLS